MLLAGCRDGRGTRASTGATQTVGEALAIERAASAAAGRARASTWWRSASRRSTALGCVSVKTNAVLGAAAGRARVRRSNSAAAHGRGLGRGPAASPVTSAATVGISTMLDLEHYLDVLEHKPGALGREQAAGAVASGWTLAGELRPVLDGLMERHGRQDGTRAMIELLQLGRRLRRGALCGGDRVGAAVGLRRRGGGAASDGDRRAAAPAAQPVAGGRQPARVSTTDRCPRWTPTTTLLRRSRHDERPDGGR